MIAFFYYCGKDMVISGAGMCFLFCFLLVSCPVSVSVFYKLVMGSCIFSCCFLVFSCWVIYTISEQFYLIKFVIGFEVPKRIAGLFNLV